MVRPDGETKRDRRRQWIVGVAAVIGLCSLAGDVILTYNSIQSNNVHHSTTVRLDDTIIAKDKQIATLLKEHSVTLAQQQTQLKQAAVYDADVLAFADTLEGQLRSLCSATHADCPVLPPIPTS